jgi:hypothetical protein
MPVSKVNAAICSMVLVIVSLPACTSLGLLQTTEERVERRAQARLDALMSQKMEKVFTFVSPAVRETTTWQRYGAGYAGVVNWREAKVISVNCEPERCEVKTAIRYQMFRQKFENTRSFTEVWIKVGTQWYIYGD